MGVKIRRMSDGQYVFHCPGCQCGHAVYVDGSGRPVWGWNGSLEAPTFTPSLNVRSSEFTEKGRRDHAEWMAAGYPSRDGAGFECRPAVCHSFVRDGRIQFLGDSTHALAGQTVDIPDWES